MFLKGRQSTSTGTIKDLPKIHYIIPQHRMEGGDHIDFILEILNAAITAEVEKSVLNEAEGENDD